MINGMNLPSIAGVLSFKDFTNQLNNANAGMRNLASLANDWAKSAYQQSNAEKNAQAQRDFQEKQARDTRRFQEEQQQERFDHELGMWNKQQESQLQNEARKFRRDFNEALGVGLSDKADTNDLNELKIRNTINEIKEHPEYFKTDEEYDEAIKNAEARANEIMNYNSELKLGNNLDTEFKELRDGDFRNAQQLQDWAEDNAEAIARLRPSMQAKISQALERKAREAQEDAMKWQMFKNQATTSNLNTGKALKEQSSKNWLDSLK